MSTEDDILASILKLEQEIADTEQNLQAGEAELEPIKKEKSAVEKSLELIRAQLTEINSNYWKLDDELRHDRTEVKVKRDELAQQKRELARAAAANKIRADLDKLKKEFLEKTLSATWRKENRTDGFGALPHQIDGSIHLAIAGQALLGDKRGLGKTLTGIAYLDLKDAMRTIIITPSDIMDNFISEIQNWAPHRHVIKLGKMPKGQRDFMLDSIRNLPAYTIVLNYEAWRKDKTLIPDLIELKCDTLILDEAHRAKTWDTSTCQGVLSLRFGWNICPTCENPDVQARPGDKIKNRASCRSCGTEAFTTKFCSIKNVLPMTGTPILNKPQELFPQLRLIDPENFRSENHFLADFCFKGYDQKWTWRYGGEKRLIDKVGPRLLIRDRKAAGVIIPPARPVTHLIPWSEMEENYPAQTKAYLQARDYAQLLLDKDSELVANFTAFITVLLRLRQVITWPAGIHLKLTDPKTDEIVYDKNIDIYESVKLDKAEEIIREVTEEGERVVLMSQFRTTLDELQRRLGPRVITYHGGTSDPLRREIQLDFDPKSAPDKPRWDAVLCNYKSAGEGLNLNAATQMVILDEEWNPGKQEQAYGRIDRIGTTRDTTIHTIRVAGTVDTWMADLIQRKKDMIAGMEQQYDVWQSARDALENGEM